MLRDSFLTRASVSHARVNHLLLSISYYVSYYTDVFEEFKSVCKLLSYLEAAIGIEPMNKGFADLCLTTWLRRRS